MSHADLLNKERWDQQRNTTTNSKLDRIIHLLEILIQRFGDEEEVKRLQQTVEVYDKIKIVATTNEYHRDEEE